MSAEDSDDAMTLHWWMHWFWVTAQIVVSLMAGSRGATSEPPTSAVGSVAVASEAMPLARSAGSPAAATGTRDGQYERTEALARLQQSYRIAKAIGIQPTPASQSDTRSSSDERTSTQPGRTPGKKETKITWIQAFSKAPRPESSSPEPPTSGEELLTVMPLRELLELREDPRKNAVRREQPQLPPANRSGEESLEPRALATAASIIEAGLVDSTRLGRARGTFTSGFQREQLAREERNQEEATGATATGSGASATEIATITGASLAIVVLLSTLGSLAFVVYRRRYLNPPQTLNSDKCSNPDSSGYIDDSTIRDNSEEMYSLDNDSFLNSLEAMTIQNYWTDSVKHTKL
ncbi:uncharacterized protein LOC100680132 isoform X5 [Nasonia vitripennis]|uniref:Uncharacterized protein n=2 Tax=Nasonia vitripennis TaxID=7425 RepID=A0A7M7QIW4_NASVI|nr:uncharacterized protein LOC100680132 isoform X5 [Nasonia vitripennis]